MRGARVSTCFGGLKSSIWIGSLLWGYPEHGSIAESAA